MRVSSERPSAASVNINAVVAIVITMATTAFMLTLAALGRSDDTRTVEDPEEESPLETRGRTASVPESAVAKEEQR